MTEPALVPARSRVADDLGLPPVPQAFVRLLSAIGDEKTGVDALAEAVGACPSIAARLLMLANSAWSAPARPVTSLDSACLRLGRRVVRSVSLALAVARPFDSSRCARFDGVRYWCSALLAAEGAALLAPHLRRHDPACDEETMRTAGLLHNLGLLWLADRCAAPTAAALEVASRGVPLGLALRMSAGFDHREAGGELALAWGLPEPLRVAMRHHGSREYDGPHWPLAAGCGAAAALASMLCANPRGSFDAGSYDGDDGDGRLFSPGIMPAVLERLASQRSSVVALATGLFGDHPSDRIG